MDKEKKMDRLRELTDLLDAAARAYYQEDREIMSNLEYDALYDELADLEKELGIVLAKSPTHRVGYEILSELEKEEHESPMLSLDKTKSPESLQGWLGSQEGLLSWKMDGLTVVLTYREGRLYKAVTRGNGVVGEVITNNARVFQNLPAAIPFAGELVLRLFNALMNADWASIGHNIVTGIQNGIAGLWQSLVSQVQEAVTNLWQSAKNALGIASPSKKFKYIGEMSVEGMEEGFEEGETDLNRTVSHVYAGMLGAAGGPAVPSAGGVESAISYNLSATGGQTTIVVPLFLDGREIARATAWNMGQQLAWEEI